MGSSGRCNLQIEVGILENLIEMPEFNVKTYHAIPLNDFKTYINQNGILSRRLLAEHNSYFTRFFSDPKDYELGCWNRTFGNFTDLGASFGNLDNYVPNAFGPITLVLKESTLCELKDVKVTRVSISQQNYDSKIHDVDYKSLSSCFESKPTGLYPKKEFRGLEFSSSSEKIELSKIAYIIVDPINFGGHGLFDVVSEFVKHKNLAINIRPRSLKNKEEKQVILNELIELSNKLHGSLLHKHIDISTYIPSSLSEWYSKLNTTGKAILASWLTYTYNGTLLHLKN